MPSETLGPFDIDRVYRAIERQRERLARAARAFEESAIDYAVCGDHAVAYWTSRVDETAVRFTGRIEILLRRDDLIKATSCLAAAGLHYRNVDGANAFLDESGSNIRHAVHVLFAGETLRKADRQPAPLIHVAEPIGEFRVLPMQKLVEMLLVSFRSVDRMHLRDLLDVGLIDAGWTSRLPPELAARLQTLLDTPDG